MWIAPEHHRFKRWAVPALALLAGLVTAIILTTREHAGSGLLVLAVLAGYAALLAFRRDEPALTISSGFGTGHRARTHLKAAAMTGDVLLAAIVGALIVQAFRGADLAPYAWLAALGGVTYAISIITAGSGW